MSLRDLLRRPSGFPTRRQQDAQFVAAIPFTMPAVGSIDRSNRAVSRKPQPVTTGYTLLWQLPWGLLRRNIWVDSDYL
jgi:hypothetical protein